MTATASWRASFSACTAGPARPPSLSRKAGSVHDFDPVAQSYDDWYSRPVGQMYDLLEKRAIAKLLPNPTSRDRLLEIGCGTGHWSAFFAKQGFRVTGLDISSRMLAIARRKQIPRAKFCQANATALPFGDNTFDVAGAITVLEFVSEPWKVIKEMVRCVRPNGYIVVGVLNRWSYLGVSRKLRPQLLFRNARFFSPPGLRALLSPHGEADVRSVACFPPWRWALRFGVPMDRATCRIGLPFGAFLAGNVHV
jgi:ubiquinone/menaquinone biosynthesis C-methylase UbiE